MKINVKKMREAQKAGFEVTVIINGEYYEFSEETGKAMYLCEHCIEAIRSHGDKVYAESTENCMYHRRCDFCGEVDELYEVYL